MAVPEEKFQEANKLVMEIIKENLPLKDLFISLGYFQKLYDLGKKYFDEDENKIIELTRLSDIIITGGEQPKTIDDLSEIFKNYLLLTGEIPQRLAKDYWQEILLEIFDKMLDFWKNRNNYLEAILTSEAKTKEAEKFEEPQKIEEQEVEEKISPVINLKKETPSYLPEVEIGFQKTQPQIDWEKIKQEIQQQPKEEIKLEEQEQKKDLTNI